MKISIANPVSSKLLSITISFEFDASNASEKEAYFHVGIIAPDESASS